MQTIQMPKLSPTMTDGVIATWHKKVGDRVEPGDVLLEIATDKATVEHAALDGGYLREILAEEGASVAVGTDIAIFTESANEPYQKSTPSIPVSASLPEVKKEVKKVESAPKSMPEGDRVFASPLAKKLAHDAGIDLHTVQGSGPRGRIMSRDLQKAPLEGTPTAPLSNMRKVISERLTYSKTHIPHFYITQPIDVTELMHLREQLKKDGYRLTVSDFIHRALALSLMEHPQFRTSFDESSQSIQQYPNADISVAVTVNGGLFTPILFHAETKSILTLSEELRNLAEKARTGKLKPQEYTGGCCTVTNIGMFGIEQFSAIINPPQCAILAVGAAHDEVRMVEERVVTRKIIKLSLSADHRILDGEVSANFIRSLQKHLENPTILLMD